MANINPYPKLNNPQPNTWRSKGTNLDTLVQLRTDTDSQVVTKGKKQVTRLNKSYQKKAKSKSISNAITYKLVDVKGSKLTKYYWNAFHCNAALEQSGKRLIGTYCNTRHCLVCNRIRAAKAINGYTTPLANIGKTSFVTLTVKAVKAEDVKSTIEQMTSTFRKVLKNLKNTYGITLKGIRKVESNYNPKADTFNPHFHLITNGKPCEILLLRTLWLNSFPGDVANIKAQDVRQTDEDSVNELFKYFTKVLIDGKLYPKAADVIFTAMKGKRTIQPFGGIKKVTEDVEDIQAEDIDFKPNQNILWQWNDDYYDWISEDGEVLSGYIPSKETIELIKNINDT